MATTRRQSKEVACAEERKRIRRELGKRCGYETEGMAWVAQTLDEAMEA
ncbi:MAG TPA: hypothetical protein VNZ64_25040 [Candidatus Acidoferrum sp.]|jgi:hypothetical protein|nr:hypothetical protein [Candidatus Acidoferrum sp.]